MPFPALDPVTLLPIPGQSFSIADYFNPSINLNYSRQTDTTFVSLQQMIDVAKLFSTPENYKEIIPFVSNRYNGADNDQLKQLYDFVYSALPDDYKYLILTTSITYFRERSENTVTYKVGFFYPSSVSYYEVSTELLKIDLNVTRIDYQNYGPTPTQAEAFKLALATVITTIVTITEPLLDRAVNDNDSNAPTLVGQTIRYSRDRTVFYPVGERENCPVAWDWTSPSRLLGYITDGHRVSTAIESRGNRLNFRASYAAGNRRHLGRLLPYSANVLDYLPYVIKGPKEPKAPTYGVELEACSDYTTVDMIAAQKDLFFILKQDGSIYGDRTHCYEMVTVPASLKAHKRLWAELFEKIDYQKFDTSKATGNGMHVHIDRKAFTPAHLNRFTWFITNPANEDFMHSVSERPTKKNFEEWAKMPNHLVQPSKILASRRAVVTNGSIRGAVHYKRDKTVEVRMFKGIVSYATIVKNLEFVDSVFFYTQETMLSQLGLRNYIAWLGKTQKNKYSTLKAFLAEVKLDEMTMSADLTERIWAESRDHSIVALLNSAPFAVTKQHIMVLNKRKRKRTFVFKDGKVICISNNGGLLAKLDKTMQQKQTRGSATFSMTTFAA